MSSSTRPTPKPRPRPRARAPATPAIPPASSPGPSTAPTTQPLVTPSIEDEDALFLRNRTRTAQTWKELSKITEEKKSRKRKSASSGSSESEQDAGSSPRARNRKKPSHRKNDTLPEWTRKRPDEIVISSDSEEDLSIRRKGQNVTTYEDGESSLRANGSGYRSRSITPPPELSQIAIQHAREAVRKLYPNQIRAPSPLDGADESMDTIVLAPELASIARRVQTEAKLHTATTADDLGGPEHVSIRVVWKSHPLNPGGRSVVWDFRQKRHDNFYRLFGEIADLASILAENLVICFEGKRVFLSSSPQSIGIWAEAELEACDKITYQYFQENKRFRSPSVVPMHTDDPNRESPPRGHSPATTELSDSEAGGAGSFSVPDEEEQSETFRLIIRSERTTDKNISVVVRPTTKCGAIVRAFLKKAGLEAEYSATVPPAKGRGRGKAVAQKVPALSVDGDRMDSDAEIGEASLEDGDQVEIVGL